MRYGKISVEGNLDVTGSLSSVTGLSGSLTKLSDGTSYLVAGNNVTITSQSNGSVLIAATGGGGGGGDSFFSSTTNGSVFTTGSVAFRGGESSIDSPSDIGSDVFFYVSGSINGSGSDDKKTLFGGDVRISGSLSQGGLTIASGNVSHAEGSATTASGAASHAEGYFSVASGDFSHAEGDSTGAVGAASHAEGGGTTAYGIGSHAEGNTTIAGCLGYLSNDAGSTTSGLIILHSAYGDVSGQFSGGDYILLEDWFYGNVYAFGSFEVSSVAFNSPNTEITLVNGMVSTPSGAVIGKRGTPAPSGADNKMGYFSHAEGYLTNAQAVRSHAEGNGTTASGGGSHAEGYSTTASGDHSHAEGSNTTASGGGSHAEGYSTTAPGDHSHAEGDTTTASGFYSHAEGQQTSATGNYSHAEGFSSTASGLYSHAEGYGTTASGIASHAEGDTTTASGDHSHAEGYLAAASGDRSHAEGYATIANAEGAHAEGYGTKIKGIYSHAEGYRTRASGSFCHAEGDQTNAGVAYYYVSDVSPDATPGQSLIQIDTLVGDVTLQLVSPAHVLWDEGMSYTSTYVAASFDGTNTYVTASITRADTGATVTSIDGSTGTLKIAGGVLNPIDDVNADSVSYAHAEGAGSATFGNASHAEGVTITFGDYSHAEGESATTYASYSHAEGSYTSTHASGSHAEGEYTRTYGYFSHAEGSGSITVGSYSHAEGLGTISSGTYQHVGGKYNTRGNDFSLFVIGDGTGDEDVNRSDIVRINPGATLGFGQFQVTGSITVSGSYLLNVVSGTSNPTYNVGSWEHVVVFTTNNVTGVLPASAPVGAQIIFKEGTGLATVSGSQMLSSSAGRIDGSATFTMPSINYTSVAVIKIKTSPEEWIIV